MAFVPQPSLAWRLWRTLVRTRVAFFRMPEAPKADVLKLCDLPAPVPGAVNHHIPTVVIDLSQSEDDLWNAILAKSRKVIRQAQREGASSQAVVLDEAMWRAFLAAYDKLWRRKQKAGAPGIGQIRDLMAQGLFEVTVGKTAEGEIVSWHAYVRMGQQVRLHTTISDIDPARDSKWNNQVGRIHRLHHWQDMLRFKAAGVVCYDFGGVYRGSDDAEQMNIARFKQSFGGGFADSYDAVLALTLKGRLALALLDHVGAATRSGAPA